MRRVDKVREYLQGLSISFELSPRSGAVFLPDSTRPESLKYFCILTPCLDENIEPRATVHFNAFEERQNCISLALHQEGERNDETLNERRGLRGLHPADHCLQKSRQNRDNGRARPPEQMYDEIANNKPARLVLVFQQFRNHCKYFVHAVLSRRL